MLHYDHLEAACSMNCSAATCAAAAAVATAALASIDDPRDVFGAKTSLQKYLSLQFFSSTREERLWWNGKVPVCRCAVRRCSGCGKDCNSKNPEEIQLSFVVRQTQNRNTIGLKSKKIAITEQYFQAAVHSVRLCACAGEPTVVQHTQDLTIKIPVAKLVHLS